MMNECGVLLSLLKWIIYMFWVLKTTQVFIICMSRYTK